MSRALLALLAATLLLVAASVPCPPAGERASRGAEASFAAVALRRPAPRTERDTL
jgi:hypothetical protein